jgi:hypothetical protein
VPAAEAIATGSPVGLSVVSGAKLYGEASARNAPEGRAKATADAISEHLRIRFQARVDKLSMGLRAKNSFVEKGA